MSKVRRAGSDMSTMSLDSLVSVGLNPDLMNETHAPTAIEVAEQPQRPNTTHISQDTTLECLLGDGAQNSGATPIDCHDLGQVLFHTVPTSVRKGTHKLLLNHPKFHVEFRINRNFQGPPKTVRLWVKIAPKGVLDRSVIINANNLPPSMQCNHCEDKVRYCSSNMFRVQPCLIDRCGWVRRIGYLQMRGCSRFTSRVR